MRPSLLSSRRAAIGQLERVEKIVDRLSDVDVSLRYLIAETLLVRITQLLEAAFAEIAYKVACEAEYLNGTTPRVLHACGSMAGARTAMLTVGRAKASQNLKWTRSKYIKASVRYVIDPTDPYLQLCDRHGSKIAEIFAVRNYATHRNSAARTAYRKVLKAIYGTSRTRPLGLFLLSTNFVRVANLKRYLVEAKVIVNELTQGDL